MDIVVIKGRATGERERMWVTRSDGTTDQVPINMVHDLPHLIVESAFGLRFGFWGLIDAGAFAREIQASQAREPKRVKAGRSGVLMGRARQSPLAAEEIDSFVAQHEDELIAAKALTNAFRGPGHETSVAIRKRLGAPAQQNAIVREKLATLDDATIERIRRDLSDADRAWWSVPPGGKIELRWPATSRPSGS
jgi:hypothetical protein